MKAKSILNQAYVIHSEIVIKREQISAIHDSIMSITEPLDQEKVMKTPDPSPMATDITQLIQLENELNEEVARLSVISREIVDLIDQIENYKVRIVLSKHYLGLKSWDVVAKEMNITKKWALNLHSIGLKQIDKILAVQQYGVEETE